MKVTLAQVREQARRVYGTAYLSSGDGSAHGPAYVVHVRGGHIRSVRGQVEAGGAQVRAQDSARPAERWRRVLTFLLNALGFLILLAFALLGG